MKVMISYPPLPSEKGVPLISQNRQYQWFNRPTFIYPVVPAYAATLLKTSGYDVVWADGVAEQMTREAFEALFLKEAPDMIAIEVKTPVVKQYWQWITRLKDLRPKTVCVLMGDHITALPEEAFAHCPVDYTITGGDFDFALKNLADHLSKKIALEPGVYWRRDDGVVMNSGKFELKHKLETLPFIDRELTKWKLYSVDNGNFKYTPGTYTMVGRDCWWGKCTFCSWTTTFTNFRVISAERALDDVGNLINLGVREIFDDTGTFPAGAWLKKFCEGMISRGYHKKIVMGCNMKPGALKQEQYDLMGKANFRFILYGVESANQMTVDRLCKGGKIEEFEPTMRMAKQGGLEPHVTCMIGYPWESKQEAQNTINLTRGLFDKGYIDTLQATIVIPYPGTPLFDECKKNDWLKFDDWDRFDMREPVMKSPIPDDEVMALSQSLYKSFMTPRFIARKILSVRNWDDMKFLAVGAGRVVGHLMDFNPKQVNKNQDAETSTSS